jgi:predicted GNAT family acetyltransferase
MERIYTLSDVVKRELLDLLYKDEVMNVFLIHYIENQPEALNELYIGRTDNRMSEVVHIKNDGNSYFTSFHSSSKEGLHNISKLITDVYREGILLVGKAEEVRQILNYLNIESKIYLNNYYKFDRNKGMYDVCNDSYNFRKATAISNDVKKLKEFIVEFFEVEDKSDIERITSDKKVDEEIKNGVYFLEIENEIVGMARYFGQSNKYIDITTVFIDQNYRSRGYGNLLMKLMVNEAIKNNKIPITQTSLSNDKTRHIYEEIGFVKVCDYTFQFI